MFEVYPTLLILAVLFVIASIKIIKEYERAVVFRLGRLLKSHKGPGIIIIIPFVDKWVRVSLRLVAMDVPPQDVITRDNVSVKVNAVLYFRVVDPNKAVTEVEDFMYATSQLAQTTLRSILGMNELDDLLSDRERINNELQNVLDIHTSHDSMPDCFTCCRISGLTSGTSGAVIGKHYSSRVEGLAAGVYELKQTGLLDCSNHFLGIG